MKKFASALMATFVLFLASLFLAGAAVAASACQPGQNGQEPYPPGCQGESTSQETAEPGESVNITSGDGEFDAGTQVSVVLVRCATNEQVADLGDATVSVLGGAEVTFTVPELPPGEYCVLFSGVLNGAPKTASTSFSVGSGSVTDGLPVTGTDVMWLVGVGSGVALLGTGVVFLARSRRVAVPA